MRYERPMIVGREPITGLMGDLSTSDSTGVSDVHAKENILPVVWPTPYESPVIAERAPIEGLLDFSRSDPVAASDVNAKENILPVAWPTPYESPVIAGRQPVEGLLFTVSSDRQVRN